ncbi:MAG: hypothetical protein ABW039_08105 [Sphingobium sp.]
MIRVCEQLAPGGLKIATGIGSVVLAMVVAGQGVSAQVRGNLAVPVAVRFEIAPDPPMEFRIVRPLSFGTVMIPNRVSADTTCTYRLRTSGVSQVEDSFRSAVDPVRGTYTGCRINGPTTTGRVAMRCAAGARIYATVFSRSAQIANIRFVESTEIEGSPDQVARGAVQTVCNPNAQGEMFVLIGGLLEVGANYSIPTGQLVQVATIQFDATYL